MKKKTIPLFSSAIISGLATSYMYISKRLFLTTLTNSHSSELRDGKNYTKLREANAVAISNWLPNTEHTHVYITSHDLLQLHGYVFEHATTNHNWVIMVHGYQTDSHSLMATTQKFYEAGYNVLLIDNRAHGKSEGTYIGMGWLERLDILEWIRSLICKDANAKIVLYGVGMGASAVMMAVGENLPNNVICAIEDCGYTSAEEILLERAQRMYPGPIVFMMKGFDFYCKCKAKYSIYEANSLKQLEKAKIPMLFIHGVADTFVPFEMVYRNYEACASEKEIYIASKHEHALACLDDNYFNVITKFINTNMK